MVNESYRASGSKWSVFFFFFSPFSSHRGVPLRDRRWRQRQAVRWIRKFGNRGDVGPIRGRQAVHAGNNESRNSWQTGLIWSLAAGVFTTFTCRMITPGFCNHAQRVRCFPELSIEFLSQISSETSSVSWFAEKEIGQILCLQGRGNTVPENGKLNHQSTEYLVSSHGCLPKKLCFF